MDNVSITLRKHGVVVHQHTGHNVWTEDGHAYLAKVLALQSYSPDVPFEDARVKYLGLGIGGVRQSSGLTDGAPYTTYYPAGSNTPPTSGNEYNAAYPFSPLIASLERPIAVSASSPVVVYPGGAGQSYLSEVYPYFTTPQIVEFLGYFDVDSTSILLAPFSEMPLSEIGLFLSSSDVEDAFNIGKLVAYHSFDTLLVTAGMVVEISWKVAA